MLHTPFNTYNILAEKHNNRGFTNLGVLYSNPIWVFLKFVSPTNMNHLYNMECPAFKKPRTSDIVPPNRAMSANFKPRLCTNFSMGHCTYGNRCQFAHDIGGVRKHLPHCRGFVREDNGISIRDNRTIDGFKVCRMFYNGKKCTYEDRCRFLHASPKKVNQVRESSLIRVKTTDGSSRDERSGFGRLDGKEFVNWRRIGDRVNSKPVVWKAKLCNNWEMTGGCPYGNTCYFAHGQAELQKFGGHIALKSGTVPTNNAKEFPTAEDGIGTSYKQQVQGMERIIKWKDIEKIIGIYADWIEDMPFPYSSSSKVGN